MKASQRMIQPAGQQRRGWKRGLRSFSGLFFKSGFHYRLHHRARQSAKTHQLLMNENDNHYRQKGESGEGLGWEIFL